MKKVKVLSFIFLFSVNNALASPLPALLRDALIHDPSVMETRAEFASARSRVEQARSAHWPVVTATGSKLLSQSHRYDYDYDSEDILPGIRGEMNIFASGLLRPMCVGVNQKLNIIILKRRKQGGNNSLFCFIVS